MISAESRISVCPEHKLTANDSDLHKPCFLQEALCGASEILVFTHKAPATERLTFVGCDVTTKNQVGDFANKDSTNHILGALNHML